MRTSCKSALRVALLVAVGAAGTAFGATIISDGYDVTTSGTGFDLNAGVNTGINPPTTRLTGTLAANLRYYQTATGKGPGAYDINSSRLRVSEDGGIGRFTLSANGSVPFDFSPALGAMYATPAHPATYDIKISMRNDASDDSRFSFGLTTGEGDATVWDFGLQVYRSGSKDTFYTAQKRIDTGSSGVADLNASMGKMTAGTWQKMVDFLIRVTDAGPESGANYHSRVQVSTNNGTSWFYDTSSDAALPNGFRFDGPSRYIDFDQAGNNSGPVYYNTFSISSTTTPPLPPQRSWTGAGTDGSWSIVGNWDGAVPSAGDSVLFTGISGQSNTNDLSNLSLSTLTFANGGFTLYGTLFTNTFGLTNRAGLNILAADLAWGNTLVKNWSVASGSELVLSNTTWVDVLGEHDVIGGGTLRQKGAFNIGQASSANPPFFVNEGQHVVDGGTFISKGGYRIGSVAGAAAGAQTILTNGATLNITATSGTFRVGDSANPVTARLVVDHSTLNTGGASLCVPYATGATGAVSQVGGTVTAAALSFGVDGAALGAYTNTGGTLETRAISEGTSGVLSYMYFDNAVLRAPVGATNAYMTGLNRAEIRSGGLTVDTLADIVIAQKFLGAGGLTKTGAATLTLNGANTYAGTTLVNAGKLVLPTGQTYAGLQVADNTELDVTVKAIGTTLTNGPLTLGSSGLCTLNFDLGSFTTPIAPLLKVTSLTPNSFVSINVTNGVQLTPGQIVLIDYDGTIGGSLGFSAFVLANLPPGVTAELVNNTANSSVDLKITGVPGLRWTGAASWDWDTWTQNWLDQQYGTPTTYIDGSLVMFLDGANTGAVNVVSFPYPPSPSTMLVSNDTLPYVLSGSALTTPLLRKNGPGSLTRVEGEADLITSIELNAGSYIVNNLYDASFASVLSDTAPATGTFVKQGASKLTLTSTNTTYNGAILVQEGTLKISNDMALGATSGATTVANGATLDLNNCEPGAEPVIVSGAGVNGQGAIIDSTTNGAVSVSLRDVTLVGDTTLGCPSASGRWDIRARDSTGPGPGLRGNGYKLTKVGPGFVSIACQRSTTGFWRLNLGDILVSQGTLAFAESLDLGNPAGTLTVSAGAKLQFYDLQLTNPIARTILMTDAGLTSSGAVTHTNVLDGPLQLSGANSFFCDASHLVINGAIGGAGSLVFGANDGGTLILNGNNTYTGDLTVTNGTVGGNGVLAGNLVMVGGTNAPGSDGVGTLTVSGNLTLAGTTRMELKRGLSPNSDRLVAGGILTFGGTLQVVLLTPPQAGDVYQLFNKGSGTPFTKLVLPSLTGYPGGLSWDTNNLAVNGSLKVTGTIAPPTIGPVSFTGGNLSFSGTGGIQGSPYYVVTSPDASAPLANWVPVASNVFGSGGSFSFTTNLVGSAPTAFFRLKVP